MAKKTNKNGKKKQKGQLPKVAKDPSSTEKRKDDSTDDAFTWEDIAAMSDSEDEDCNIEDAIKSNTKAKNLRQAITNNMTNLLTSIQKESSNNSENSDEFEDVVLDDSSSQEEEEEEGENDDLGKCNKLNDLKEKQSDEIIENEPHDESFINQIKNRNKSNGSDDDSVDNSDDDDNGDDDDDDDDNGMEGHKNLQHKKYVNSKALSAVIAELESIHSNLPWAETFVIVPQTPLPFGEHRDPENNPLDIHDDLKREVAFYNNALEAVTLAREKCEEVGLPFSRPEDFFAEMVKTDDHMARIKDRLIFENKKIEAVAQRRSNKEQKLRSKESQANRLAEKAKRKKEHFQEVEEWANSVAKNRGGALREGIDDHFLNRNNGSGPNKKRQSADRKFGHGGKRGRFKQNDRKSMNDVSGYNPRGNFSEGMKRTAKNGAGASRSGKRARDAKRARK